MFFKHVETFSKPSLYMVMTMCFSLYTAYGHEAGSPWRTGSRHQRVGSAALTLPNPADKLGMGSVLKGFQKSVSDYKHLGYCNNTVPKEDGESINTKWPKQFWSLAFEDSIFGPMDETELIDVDGVPWNAIVIREIHQKLLCGFSHVKILSFNSFIVTLITWWHYDTMSMYVDSAS